MRIQIVEQVELFSEAELESLEFVPEELEAIEAERVPDLDSISFEDIAKELEAYFEEGVKGVRLESGNPVLLNRITQLEELARSLGTGIRRVESELFNLQNVTNPNINQKNRKRELIRMAQQLRSRRYQVGQELTQLMNPHH